MLSGNGIDENRIYMHIDNSVAPTPRRKKSIILSTKIQSNNTFAAISNQLSNFLQILNRHIDDLTKSISGMVSTPSLLGLKIYYNKYIYKGKDFYYLSTTQVSHHEQNRRLCFLINTDVNIIIHICIIHVCIIQA